jgi:hypothetical protein
VKKFFTAGRYTVKVDCGAIPRVASNAANASIKYIVFFKIKNPEKKKLKFLTTSHLSLPPTENFKTNLIIVKILY